MKETFKKLEFTNDFTIQIEKEVKDYSNDSEWRKGLSTYSG